MTTLKLKKIQEMYSAGATTKEIAESIGVERHTVYRWMHKIGICPENRHSKHRKSIYSVYDENDNLIATGSADECAKILGCREDSIYRGVMVTRRGIAKKRFFYSMGKDDAS